MQQLKMNVVDVYLLIRKGPKYEKGVAKLLNEKFKNAYM